MYNPKRYTKACVNCSKDFESGKKLVKYCSISCYNTHTKTKEIDGYKPCEICKKEMPYRNSLNVRSYKGIASVKTRFCSKFCLMQWRNYIANPSLREDVRAKMSAYRKENPPVHLWYGDAREKQKKTISGEGHWNWQGGITPENKRRRNLAEYKAWRTAVFERDDYICQICSARNGNGVAVCLQADHIKPWCKYPELRLDIDNGRTLCVECHRKTETFGVKAKNHE